MTRTPAFVVKWPFFRCTIHSIQSITSDDPVIECEALRQWKPTLVKFLLLLIPALLTLGSLIFILRGIAFHKDALKRWRDEAASYQEQAEKWQHKSEHFKEEWKAKLAREVFERELAGLTWGEFVGEAHCASSGRRAYKARLLNLTPTFSAVEACKSTSATINNITYKTPLKCEDQVNCNVLMLPVLLTSAPQGTLGVYGYWVAENEAVCSTYWDHTERKDCVSPGSGLRRYEAKFGDVHAGEDAEMLCLSTPITFYGRFFERPTACVKRGYGSCERAEYWSIWDIPVRDC
ncbi:hypothetical protein DXG01_002606 [Tephrocybe rancida]|nr:hypothetical protein DXG01_002606 [Tephrocybe rancida]